jgi:catechol 2,3-dioxygenase-like lactoylglutathione lyase family enzyme
MTSRRHTPVLPRLVTPQPARCAQPTVRATALSHLIFERPDLELAQRFLTDFGLQVVSSSADMLLLRGAGTTAYCYRVHRAAKARFVGFGLGVATSAHLQRLASVPGASSIQAAAYPGGGECVRLTDPSGFVVEAVCGQRPVTALESRGPLRFNLPGAKPRINDTQRPPSQPPEISKLGHVVLEVADYQATSAWYTQHFGFIPSDVQVLQDGSPAVTFFRLDLGDTPADHHALAMAQGFMPAYSHSAFEVVDADAVGMGQRILRERGWKHAWGIGRHILGSQIFDYWCDPWGARHEHYCDGDVFTAEQPVGVHAARRDAMAQWGQPMPGSFVRPQLTREALSALVRNLRRSPDVTLGKLVTLARLFG